MTKEEMMALKLRQILPYLQMHEAAKGNHLGPIRSPRLTDEENAAIQEERRQEVINRAKTSM